MRNLNVVCAVIRNGKRIFATQRGYGEFKDGWEFPGGKIEPGEGPRQALKREIREELATEVEVGDLIDQVEFDYSDFHLSMRCYWCSIISGELTLLEAEASKWLLPDELPSLNWLPADRQLIEKLVAEGIK
ncbi:MAG: (deoxy)nucleoside triphosphate pyrophosphohydrolase [Lachnospiraceae bacterium]|nr:(deoxy)nucleoside triphosphate pyrophosphohydrolase [Lachnospiraceae bacterium]